MRTAYQGHTGLRVASIERSLEFYVRVFQGVPAGLTRELPESVAEAFFSLRGVQLRVMHVRIGDGAVELIELLGLAPPQTELAPAGANFWPHFAIFADDLVAARDTVEAAGGRLLSPLVKTSSSTSIFFCADPDGHPIEVMDYMIDASLERAAREAHKA